MRGAGRDRRRVDVLSLGGTIAMTYGTKGIAPRLTADELTTSVPGLALIAEVAARSVLTIPSCHLRLEDVVALAAVVTEAISSGADGVVVTQGTDTLEETAYALDLLLPRGAPVIVTGALRGADALSADGPANLTAAVRVAADPASRFRGVLAVLNDEVHLARWVTKTHTSRPNAFASPAAGPVGLVTEDRVQWFWPAPDVVPTPGPQLEGPLPSVLLVPTWLGDEGTMMKSALSTMPDGLVVEGLGAGHVPPGLVDPLTHAAATIPTVLTSAVGSGEVHRCTYDYRGSESDLLGRGVLWGRALPGRKARILLVIAIASSWSQERLVRLLAEGEDRP